jgi:alkanesulfonate monooxygenase SsuD/methylene tetrahydromethanopterin reductase-like flavin-dependent oxidoreductase (luciferase family)
MSNLALGILDFGYLKTPELYAHQVINSLFNEIGEYERMGYKRLWLSEHYSPEFAWFNPRILLPLLAGYSERIRVGIAGVLLNHHSSLQTAHDFRLLSALYPERIDLGIARAGVPDDISRYLYRHPQAGQAVQWEAHVNDLFAFLKEDDSTRTIVPNLLIPPHGTTLPETWFLGTSGSGIELALKHRSNFCLSLMHPGADIDRNASVIKKFKKLFFDKYGVFPLTSILICASDTTDQEQLERLKVNYNKLHQANPFGPMEFIVEYIIRLSSQLGSDEVVVFYPEHRRELRIDFFNRLSVAMNC